VSTEPWSGSALVQRALVEESTGALAAARVDARRAVAREPDDWAHEVVLSRIEAESGHARAALTAFRAAQRLRPRAQLFAAPPPFAPISSP
jgi:cytochrome c-type biogenesis protein CcmH/NrfG